MRLRKILLALLIAVCTALQGSVFSAVNLVHALGDEFEPVDEYWMGGEVFDGVTGKSKGYSIFAVSENKFRLGTEMMLSIECKQRKLIVSLTGDDMDPYSELGRGTIQVRIDQGKLKSFPFKLSYVPWDKTIYDGVVFLNPKSITSSMLKAKAEISFKYNTIWGSPEFPAPDYVTFAIDNFRTFRDDFKSRGCPLN